MARTPRTILAFFGEPWTSPLCTGGTQYPTPVGEDCEVCHQPIRAGDQGALVWAMVDPLAPVRLPHHRECVLRVMVGGIGHIVDCEFWCQLHQDGDAGLSLRSSAVKVWEHFVAEGLLPA